MTGDTKWEDLAEKTLRAFSKDLKRVPSGYTAMLLGFMFESYGSKEIVVVGSSKQKETKSVIKNFQTLYIPQRILIYKDANKELNSISQLAPWTKYHESKNGKPTIYICEDFACNLPTTDLEKAVNMINK